MKLSANRSIFSEALLLLLSLIVLILLTQEAAAQEPPPRPVEVTSIRDLGFGAFAIGAAGGTISINTAGARSYTGDIVLLNLVYTFSSATYRFTGNRGTVISILNGPDITLTGSNGGTMTLHLGISDPPSPFEITTTPPASTLMNIGGTLTVGSSATCPPGNYAGTFYITFIQE
jgi:hypothetical protein